MNKNKSDISDKDWLIIEPILELNKHRKMKAGKYSKKSKLDILRTKISL